MTQETPIWSPDPFGHSESCNDQLPNIYGYPIGSPRETIGPRVKQALRLVGMSLRVTGIMPQACLKCFPMTPMVQYDT